MLYFRDEEKFNKFNEEMKIIEKWNKRLQLNWLRKQRDGIIGYLQEKINKLNITKTKPILSKQIKHLKHVAKELTELNYEIYDIEINLHSKESVYSGPSSETKKNKSESESDSKSDSKSDSESDSESDNDLFIHTKCGGIIKKSDPRIQFMTKKNELENESESKTDE